jgi:FkbM family methyltransferase
MPKKSHTSLIDGSIYRVSFYRRFVIELRKKLFRAITKNALPLFFRVKDIISISPVLRGTYEPEINALFEALCGMGFNGYLLDIGSNIGLTITQNSFRFESVFGYEPNPIAFAILTANCYQLDKTRLHLFPFGIGTHDEILQLRFSENNLGGAEIAGEDNLYAAQGLSADGGSWTSVPVQIRCGATIFGEVFEALSKSDQKLGVIKIDAEGYELSILKQLAISNRCGAEFVVVFENWSPLLKAADVFDLFSRSGFIYKLEWNMRGLSKARQFARLAMRGERFAVVDSYRDLVGTVIYSTRPLS